MELLETADPAKRRLMEEVRSRREQLDVEAASLAKKSSKKLSNALIIAGVLVGSYLIYKAISASQKSSKEKTLRHADEKNSSGTAAPKTGNAMGSRLAQIAAVFLLNMARERVAAWLASKKEPHEAA